MRRWKAAALVSLVCSSLLSFWMCQEGLLLGHRLGPALAPLRRPPRTLDARLARLAQYRALLQGAPDAVELRELSPGSGTRPCGLRELEVRVSELGLGYTSDETVLFRYCAGACEAALRIYDLGLRRLRQRRRVRKERVRAHPCCRPTAYEDEVSFLDVHSRYHTLQELSARECACV
uniref:neurturin n=1 Tax=Myodes glareolus TaxID=447135 RepID=UPI0020212578|nr:neurturin [Myodes glareolus]